jgi:hypothetical protein
MPALRLEGLGRRRRCVRPVPLAVVALPDAAELPPGTAPVEGSTDAALQPVQLLGSAHSVRSLPGSTHSVRPRPGSARCGLARREAARFEGSRRVVDGHWAVAMARLWGPETRPAVLLRPLAERQTQRCTQHSVPERQPQAPWRDRRDRRWRSSGK